MPRLSHKGMETFQVGLRELYAHHDLDTLPRTAMRVARRLVECDMAAYNEINPQAGRAMVAADPAEWESKTVDHLPAFERYMHQHPVLTHFLAKPNTGPKKISDFLSLRQFQRLELYQQLFAPLHLRYQMVTPLRVPLPLAVGLTMNRQHRDFNEVDRYRLSLLQPHLLQAYENAAVITDLTARAQRYERLFESLARGMVLIDSDRRIHDITTVAAKQIKVYLPHESNGSHLPETLDAWAAAQIQRLTRSVDSDLAAPTPLILESAAGRLVVRVTADRKPGEFLLIMHEAVRPTSAEPLRGLGLSHREADVLLGVVEGRTNNEIGTILSISARTVHKHLEHVYAKLHVAGRPEAIGKALEWLRL